MEQEITKTDHNLNEKRLLQAGLVYSIAVALPIFLSLFVRILLLLFGFTVQEELPDWYSYLLYLIPQISSLSAVLFYFYNSKDSVRQVYSNCKWYYFPVAIALQFGLLFALSPLNDLFLELLRRLGYVSSGTPLPALDGWRVLPALIVIALFPALLEETVFRGILARNMQRGGWGLLPTVLISGALFSLFHANPEQTVYQFICGICFALIAVRAGSVLPTIVAHFVNNAAIILLTSQGLGNLSDLGGTAYILLVVFAALSLVAALIFLIFFSHGGNRKGRVGPKSFFLCAGVGIAVCAVQWIYLLIAGFIHG